MSEPEVWVDYDYPPPPRNYAKCQQCGDALILRHVCTDNNLRFLRKFPGECCAEVSRNGETQPCNKTAVAVAYGNADSDNWWPVCPHHCRGRPIVPLTKLIDELTKKGTRR